MCGFRELLAESSETSGTMNDPTKLKELTAAVEKSLRAADELGLVAVGIKLNDAIVALTGAGLPPPIDDQRPKG